jgi:hypothetical protein
MDNNVLILIGCGFAWFAMTILIVLFFMGASMNETPTPKGLDDD